MIQHWTFETLARADKVTLEKIMREGSAPEIEKLNGFIYCGWNCNVIGKLTGEKFKKGFCQKDGVNYGFNETVVQDKTGYSGCWKMKASRTRPFQMGYFRVSHVKEESIQRSYHFYHHLVLFNYKLPVNKRHMSFFKGSGILSLCPMRETTAFCWAKPTCSCGARPGLLVAIFF